jgi:phosphocarrier protein HPr
MKRKQVTIINKTGLHARAASLFVSAAGGFSSDIDVIRGDTRINAKSIMGIMSGGIARGDQVIIEADGDDEDEALATLAAMIEDGFGEV